MIKFGHIINPVVVNKSSDLFAAQPVTLETLKAAREFAEGRVNVELYSAQYPEDLVLVPEGFKLTPNLDRSILDIAEFSIKRKLPLITDILNRLYDASEADYLIYTNVDMQ